MLCFRHCKSSGHPPRPFVSHESVCAFVLFENSLELQNVELNAQSIVLILLRAKEDGFDFERGAFPAAYLAHKV